MSRHLFVVAHPDDDLLFMNPTILRLIGGGHVVQAVYLSAGDAGRTDGYWQQRQRGINHAYARMAQVGNSWRLSPMRSGGLLLDRQMLRDNPKVTQIFFNLPDQADPTSGGRLLSSLFAGAVDRISTVEGSRPQMFTRPALIESLRAVIDQFQPDRTHLLDYPLLGPDDHSDHYASAQFAFEAHKSAARAGEVVSYVGYSVASWPDNVSGPSLLAKTDAFYAYAAFDDNFCASPHPCDGNTDRWGVNAVQLGNPEPRTPAWLSHQRAVHGNGIEPAAVLVDGTLHAFCFNASEGALRHVWEDAGGWRFENLDGPGGVAGSSGELVGRAPAVTVLPDGSVHVFSYSPAGRSLRHAWISPGVGPWRFETLDGGAGSVSGSGLDVGNGIAATHLDGRLQVFCFNASEGALRHVWEDAGGWRFENLDGPGGVAGSSGELVGRAPAVTVLPDGSVHVFSYSPAGRSLRHAWISPGVGPWRFETLDGGAGSVSGSGLDVGNGIAATHLDGRLQVFCFNASEGALRHVWQDADGWRFENLDGPGGVAGSSGELVGRAPAVTVLPDGSVHVFSYSPAGRSLRHAWISPGVGPWRFETLDGGAGSVSGSGLDVGNGIAATHLDGRLQVFCFNASEGALRHVWQDADGWHFQNRPPGDARLVPEL